MAKNYSVGIDVGTHQTKVVVVGHGSNRKSGSGPQVLGTGHARSQGLRYGYVVNPQEVTQSIKKAVKKAEKSARQEIHNATISVSGVSVESLRTTGGSSISRGDNEVTRLDIRHALEASERAISDSHTANRQILHTIPLAYQVDGQKVLGKPEGMKGHKLVAYSLFVTCLTQHLHDLVEAVEEAGITVNDVVAGPLATGEILLSKAQKIAGCVLANIGAETVSIAVYDNEIPVSLEVFPIGGTDITNDIALGLKISLDEAERIKLGGITSTRFSKEKLEEIIEARLSDVFELIGDHLEEINRDGLLPAGIILTGSGAGVGDIETHARNTLNIPAEVIHPKFLNKHKADLPHPSWTTAFGCAALDLTEKTIGDFEDLQSHKNGIISWVSQFLP